MGFLDKIKNLLSKNADKVDTAIDKAGDIVDQKTQGKYAQHVDKVQDAAKKAVDDKSNRARTTPRSPARRYRLANCPSPSTFRCRRRRHGRAPRTCPATRNG